MSILIAIKRGHMSGRRSVISPMSSGNVHGTHLMLAQQRARSGMPFQAPTNAIGYGLRAAPGGGPGGNIAGRFL